MSVIHNTQRPESMLKNNSNYICYHAVRESIAMGESLTGTIVTKNNCSNLATKVLYGEKRKFYMPNLLYDIYYDMRTFWTSILDQHNSGETVICIIGFNVGKASGGC